MCPEAVTLSIINTLHFSFYPQNEYVIIALHSSYKNLMSSGMERPWLFWRFSLNGDLVENLTGDSH